MSEVCSEYMDTVYLSWGYPIFVLRTKQHKDTCIFLKSSKCIVYDAKPRACRTYPIGVGPNDEIPGNWLSFMVSKSQHHFKGQRYLVGDWLDKNFTLEDKEFVEAHYNDMGELVELMMKIDKQHEEQVINLILFYK